MERKSFFKSLIGLIIAPKVISEIDWEPKNDTLEPADDELGTDLNLLIPQYYKQYMDRYGSDSYNKMIEMFASPYPFPNKS